MSTSPLRRASDSAEADRMPPLTEDQLQLLSEQTRRATRIAVRRYRNQALVGFLALCVGTGVAFKREDTDRSNARKQATAQRTAIVQSGRAVSVDGCNRDFRTISATRGVLIASMKQQHAALERGDISQTAYERGVVFFNAQLQQLPLPDCRNAINLLTDAPGAKIVVPVPLHP